MYKKFIIVLLITKLIAQENNQNTNIYSWNQVGEVPMKDNYTYDKKIYHTDNIIQAASATLIESLYHMDKVLEKKKLQTDFKYLKDFD